MNDQTHKNDDLVVSYLLLRRLIGYFGVVLPFVLAVGAWLFYGDEIQSSISAYYHTEMRDVFVGILCAIGVFMLSYKGYEKRDNRAGNMAFIGAVGVAWFPVAPAVNPTAMQTNIAMVHYISASLFFLTLAYFCLRLFRLSNPAIPPTPRKLMRNRVYTVCGYTIIACIALIAVYKLAPQSIQLPFAQCDPVFWLEALAIVVFGFSWMTKGEAILADRS